MKFDVQVQLKRGKLWKSEPLLVRNAKKLGEIINWESVDEQFPWFDDNLNALPEILLSEILPIKNHGMDQFQTSRTMKEAIHWLVDFSMWSVDEYAADGSNPTDAGKFE